MVHRFDQIDADMGLTIKVSSVSASIRSEIKLHPTEHLLTLRGIWCLGRRRIMAWPVWRLPLDLAAVQVLVEHPALRPTPHDTVARPEPSVPRDRIALHIT
ncbi:hypothetical protein GCM10022402_12550 [Salinactinospora qingdaonensis]|uniref:Uncharacterized protein n=1 Tax=Salinactinospora qingdaonensis TaxID=702744 RepID=A0ABP7F8J8_9ACTN